MRADRLLSILLLLQVHKQMTTGELAKHLEVSDRTIHRDMEALSSAGFPVYAERGKHGGWKLLDDFQTRIIHLNQSEIPVLFLPLPEKLLKEMGMDKDAKTAQMKLLSFLPEKVREDAENISQRIYLDTASWHPSIENKPFLPVLQTALWQNQKVLLTYMRSDGETRERLVHPLGLVAKGNTWYLVASVNDEIRTYRVSRIKDAQLSGETFVRPPQFDLVRYWEESSQQFIKRLPQYHVVVRADPAIVDKLPYPGRFPKIKMLDEHDRQGWKKISLQFQIEQEACAYIMGFGKQMEILQPEELRTKVQRLAKEILGMYSEE
ncbi:helix-turn-helix transcriptional regulator [Paenactinomyces guangxiensis]|nr:YafY family protein [Paenactinomyces guangxiensis]